MVSCEGESVGRPGRDPGVRQCVAPCVTNNADEKYGLRPRTSVKRLQGRQEAPKAPTKSKSRPAPLSKYRRKTANARERHRMKEINTAFETLHKVLPECMEVEASSSNMTKITTLRLAVDYIRALSDVLHDYSFKASDQLSLHQEQSTSVNVISPLNPQGTPSFLSQITPSFLLQAPQLLSCYSTSHSGTTTSPVTSRDSFSSGSDLEDLFSDDSCLLEDNLDVFYDIPALPLTDSLDILLEKDVLSFTTELYNY